MGETRTWQSEEERRAEGRKVKERKEKREEK